MQNQINQLQQDKDSTPVDEAADWQTYQNEQYGFKFQYPSPWKISDETGPPYGEPYIFHIIVMPVGHVINKAGHVSVLNISLEQAVQEVENSHLRYQISNIEDFDSTSFKGKKYQLAFESNQIDYKYFLELDDQKTIFISFGSFDEPEKLIPPQLMEEIDKFVQAFSIK